MTQTDKHYKLNKNMEKLTKEEALLKIEELKKYVAQGEAEEKKGFVIKSWKDGFEIYVSKCDNARDAVIEAVKNGVNLYGADLCGINLSETDLNGANLSETRLYGTNFCGANLSKANLNGADFYGARLYGTNFYEANLNEADLNGANLNGASFREAELSCAKFYGKGCTVKLKQDQVDDFLNALGFQIEK
jgi:hypothetical protein